MMLSSDNMLIGVVDNIITDVVFSGYRDRELTGEEKQLIRSGLKSAPLKEILKVLFKLERFDLRKIVRQVLDDNRDIISDQTKYVTARIGDIGATIYFLSEYLDSFSEEVLLNIKNIIQQKLDVDSVDEIIIFLKSMYSAGMLEKIMEFISNKLVRRIRNMSFGELIKLLYWMPRYSFERVLNLARNHIRKGFSSATPEQIRMFLLALSIKDPVKLNVLFEYTGDIVYSAEFEDYKKTKLQNNKRWINSNQMNIIIIFHSKIEQQDREIVISTVKETFEVSIRTEGLSSVLEDFIDIFNIRDIYLAHHILDVLNALYDNIFLLVAPYKIIVDDAPIEADFYIPTIRGGLGMRDIGAIVSVYPEMPMKKEIYIHNVIKHELGHIFGLDHCENDCVMGELQEKPMRFCERCRQILIEKRILKKP